MRINKFVAQATGMSRRAADVAVSEGRVLINGNHAEPGSTADSDDTVLFEGKQITLATTQTVMFNKPTGYVVSRDGQGAATIYDILPPELQALKPVGRLDKDSSGLLLLTNDGDLANELTHPKHQKRKAYQIQLNKNLQPLHRQLISDRGITLEDGVSKLELERQQDGNDKNWTVTMYEGRNRQIRRTFESLGYHVATLHRTEFGMYLLGRLASGKHQPV